MNMYISKGIDYRNWLTWLWNPWSPTSWHLQAGKWESWWYNSVCVQGLLVLSPRVQRTESLEMELQGQEKMDIPAREERGNSVFFCLFVPFRPSVDWMLSARMGEIDLYSCIESNANISQEHPHGDPQKYFPSSLGVLYPNEVDT